MPRRHPRAAALGLILAAVTTIGATTGCGATQEPPAPPTTIAGTPTPEPSPTPYEPVFPKGATVAFFGDQGLGGDAEDVLRLVRDEGADAVLHLGDFDYRDDAAAWIAQIDAILGVPADLTTRGGLHPLLRDDILRDAERVF